MTAVAARLETVDMSGKLIPLVQMYVKPYSNFLTIDHHLLKKLSG